MKTLSIIVPCFNEEAALPIFYNELTAILSEIEYNYELIFVNDGSIDNTLNILKNLAQKDSHIKYLSFSRNFGKESAMYAGFCNALGDYVAAMDADMQDPPSLLPKMLSVLESGEYDSVATKRESRKGELPIRSWFARKFYKIFNKISSADIMDGARDFRLMKREMVDAIIAMDETDRFSKGIFGWIGFKTYWLSFDNVERVAGKTKWSFWKLFKYAIGGIINFSQTPCCIAMWFGIGITFISFVLLVLSIVIKCLNNNLLAAWIFVIFIITFIGGLQLLCLGIIGQYVAKAYSQSQNRPHYIISETNDPNAIKIK